MCGKEIDNPGPVASLRGRLSWVGAALAPYRVANRCDTETFNDRYWSASREPQRSMTSRGYDPRQSPGLGYKRVVSCKDSFHGTCWPYRNTALRDDGRTSMRTSRWLSLSWWWACEARPARGSRRYHADISAAVGRRD